MKPSTKIVISIAATMVVCFGLVIAWILIFAARIDPGQGMFLATFLRGDNAPNERGYPFYYACCDMSVIAKKHPNGVTLDPEEIFGKADMRRTDPTGTKLFYNSSIEFGKNNAVEFSLVGDKVTLVAFVDAANLPPPAKP